MVLLRRGRHGFADESIRTDPLVQKLRDVILNGRAPGVQDRKRAFRYNVANIRAGLPFRAPVR